MTVTGDPKTIRLVVITLATALAGLGILVLLKKERTDKPNPYEYDLSAHKKIDPSLIKYRETRTVSIAKSALHAVATDRKGRIFVAAEDGKGSILEFDGAGDLVSEKVYDEFPHSIAVGPKGKIYIGLEDHVAVLDPSNKTWETWSPLGEKAILTSIAAGAENVYVADSGQRRVWRFDTTGALKGVIGEKDPAKGEQGFLIPGVCFDLALDPSDHLLTVDPGHWKVQRRTPEGELLSSWGEYGLEIDKFCGC
jgi:hypothetical protein